MKRRDFLKNSMYASMAAGAGLTLPLHASAACNAVDMPRTLVNLMLYGGMDSKFIFMPAPSHTSSNYLDRIWEARS